MEAYSLIKIDRNLAVPASSVFVVSEDGQTVYIHAPGFSYPWEVGGAIGEAVKSFLSGDHQFQVNCNGVLDLYGGLMGQVAAQKALGQTFNYPMVEVGKVGQGLRSEGFTDIPTPQEFGAPSINVDAIAAAIRGRK